MTSKTYSPIVSLDEAELLIPTKVLDSLDDGQRILYAEILKLHHRIDEIENQANEMMSPEAMSKMAAGFLGQ